MTRYVGSEKQPFPVLKIQLCSGISRSVINMAMSLIRPNSFGLLVAIVMGFHCMVKQDGHMTITG